MNLDENQNSTESEGALKKIMRKVFNFYNPDDAENTAAIYDTPDQTLTAPSAFEVSGGAETGGSSLGAAGTSARDVILTPTMPTDRLARYQIYAEMAEDSILSGAVEMLLSYALSPNNRTNLSFTLKAKDPKHAAEVEKLNNELIKPINEKITSWAYVMAVYGVNYIRPYAEKGRGIVSFEGSYYTLPNQIKEFEKSGELAGFTSVNLKRSEDGRSIRLADPWALIPLKIPSWHPNLNTPPTNTTGREYSLFDDVYSRLPVETQNYGSSLLHPAYSAWVNLTQSLRSLLASRQNASRIDRLISVSTNNLDPARAAQYVNNVMTQLKNDREAASRIAAKNGILPTVFNSIIPVMEGGAKGGIAIDTVVPEANITAIEDVQFFLKAMCGSIGIDPSLLGYSDQMSGGLGDGGWLTASIQSAIRAGLIRNGVKNFVYRAIDIHTAFRDGKVWLESEYPFELQFNTLNCAIANEDAIQNERKANFASIVASTLDLIENSLIAKSATLKGHIYKDLLDMDEALADKIISELASAAKESTDENMMESISGFNDAQIKKMIGETLYAELSSMKGGEE